MAGQVPVPPSGGEPPDRVGAPVDRVVPRPAATVVLLRSGPRGPEVLLTRRPSTMAFGPGLHVFPGGALDVDDRDPRLLEHLRGGSGREVPPTHDAPFMVAAIRELFEETGILLATTPGDAPVAPEPGRGGHRAPTFLDRILSRNLVLRGDWLVPLSRWVTPPVAPRRYDARFFVAALPAGAVPAFDPHEVAGHAWLTPREALGAMATGRIELWTPTSTTLQQLAAVAGPEDVRRWLAPRGHSASGGAASTPPIAAERLGDLVTRIRVDGAGGIPGQAVDAYLVGRRRLVVVDPGDPNDAAAEAIMRAAAGRSAVLVGIVLTAPVADHAAGAEGLSLRLGIPVLAAAGARQVLVSDIEPLGDGDQLGLADTEVRVLATPGTHPDHLAFDVPEAGVVLVGDLEGPGPSRAVPEPVDLASLARSRAMIDALGGRVRLAAHR